MNAIELIGDIDDQHQLHAQVPKELPTGRVRLIVLLSGEDEAGGLWAHGIAAEWSAQLQDPREDIYTLDDGRPVNAPMSFCPGLKTPGLSDGLGLPTPGGPR